MQYFCSTRNKLVFLKKIYDFYIGIADPYAEIFIFSNMCTFNLHNNSDMLNIHFTYEERVNRSFPKLYIE